MEKYSQTTLYNLLISNGFSRENMYFTPRQHPVLRDIFKNCSKKNTKNRGIPDLLYLEDDVIIIFECKAQDLYKAKKCFSVGVRAVCHPPPRKKDERTRS